MKFFDAKIKCVDFLLDLFIFILTYVEISAIIKP